MSNYLIQEFDFVERTAKIIEQYETFQIPQKEKYDVTLFLNCLVGLVILPRELWMSSLPTDLISKWGLDENHISCIKEETATIRNVVIHIRNSISHYRFRVFANTLDEIHEIKFEDFDPKTSTKTFEATFPVSDLRTFVSRFSSSMIEKMKQQKP